MMTNMKMNSKERDAFFTKEAIASRFVGKVDSLYPLVGYDTVLEPSAGAGSILKFLPKETRVGIDLQPETDEVVAMDFFDYTQPEGKTIVIGNPPFGRQSKLAIDFFNRCAHFADVIAFIIPRSWMKYRIQSKLDNDFELYSSLILPDKAFTLDGKEHAVRCCAQVWGRYEPTGKGTGGYDSWNDAVTRETLDDIDAYQLKHGCYEKS